MLVIAGIILFSALGVAVTAIVWPRILLPAVKRLTPDITWNLSITAPLVALSFDDGPDPQYTPQVLEILKRHDVKATFFLVGERARMLPELTKAICGEGHEIGNHSYTWRPTIQLDVEDFKEDLVRAERQIGNAPCSVRLFRPAGMWISRRQLTALGQLGYRCVLGSAYGHDPYEPPAGYIAWAVARSLRPGAIVVLHDSGGDRSNTIAALPGIIASARRRGLEFCPISQLIGAAHSAICSDT